MSKLRIILPSFLLLIFTLCFTYVYASFSNDMMISATAKVDRVIILINSVTFNSSNGNASYSTPIINNDYDGNENDSFSVDVTLAAGASITFNVTLTNYSVDNYEITDMNFNNNNLDVLYSDQGCFLADNIDAHNTYTCRITVTNNKNYSVSDVITTNYVYAPITDYTFIHHLETLFNGIDDGYIDDIKNDMTDTSAYHYVGTNPRNYVELNGYYWRILGIEYNVKDSASGTAKTKVKLIKETGIGDTDKLVWDSTGSSTNKKMGIADWSTSKLKDVLNGAYYSSSMQTCYYNDKSNWAWPCLYYTKGLSSNELISSTLWHTGATSSASIRTPLGLYQDLMSTNTAAIGNCSGNTCNSGNNMTYQSVGKVGIIAPSDYGYSTNGNSQSSRDSCLNTSMSNAAWKRGGNCYSGSWLTHNTGTEWTIQPGYNNNDYATVLNIASTGEVSYDNAYRSFYLRPVIYIDPDAHYFKGDGLKTNPYIIDQDDADGLITITYDGNGATSGSMSVQVIAKGKSEFTRTGYTFLGWSKNANATTPTYLDQATVAATENSTNTVLYAIWQKETSFYEMIESSADKTTVIDFSQTSEATNTNGIYKYTGQDSDGGSDSIYYYRGNVNNNIIFANYCWKIMRTTSTGGIKLIFNGTPTDGACTGNVTSVLSQTAYNSSSTKEAAGYKYEVGVQHGTANDSTVKVVNDAFIYNNIRGYVTYLDDLSFCNDRSVATGYNYTDSTFHFNRYDLGTPTLSCPNASDNFTVGASHGNAQLSLPIGLITADEMILAGAKNGADAVNSTYYLKTNYQYWTVTPRYYNGTTVKMWRANSDGSIGTADNESNNKYFRPVIALNENVYVERDSSGNPTGNGSAANPYNVLYNHRTQYAVSYDGNGATSGSMTYQLVYDGDSVKLLPNAFSKPGYHFLGWSTRYDTTVQFDDEETITITGDLILYASWEKDETEFNYTGSAQTYTVPKSGYYKLEAWGAQGGTVSYNNNSYIGGYGAYATGVAYLHAGTVVNITVGASGSGYAENTSNNGPYGSGGGASFGDNNWYGGTGGGATDFSIGTTYSSTLDNLTYKSTSAYYNGRIMVASGGGGAVAKAQSFKGGDGGGSTSKTTTGYSNGSTLYGASQNAAGYNSHTNASSTTVGGLGYGGRGLYGGGGGSGYYGGGGGYGSPGSGGSSYIGGVESSHNITKHMMCYDCTADTSSADTYTYNSSTYNCHSSTATSNCAKEGNGYALLTYLGEY